MHRSKHYWGFGLFIPGGIAPLVLISLVLQVSAARAADENVDAHFSGGLYGGLGLPYLGTIGAYLDYGPFANNIYLSVLAEGASSFFISQEKTLVGFMRKDEGPSFGFFVGVHDGGELSGDPFSGSSMRLLLVTRVTPRSQRVHFYALDIDTMKSKNTRTETSFGIKYCVQFSLF